MTEKKTQSTPAPRRKARLVVRIVKALALTVLGVLLFFAGILVCAVSILTPERLTPIVEHIATRSLVNARVSADRVELYLRSTMPYLQVEVDNLSVISSAIDSLAPEQADSVPVWADTVMSVRNFHGGINIGAILINRLSFNDVIADRPTVNYVVVNDSVTNFNIFPPSEEEKEPEKPFDWGMMPSVRIRRLAIVNPGPVRYMDVSTGTDFTVNLKEASVSGVDQPLYTMNFDGDVNSPLFMKYFTFLKVAFGLNGNIFWDQKEPWTVSVDGMKLGVGFFHGTLGMDLDFRKGLVLNRLDIDVDPINVNNVLAMLSDSFKTEYSIPLDIRTDALVKIKGHLTKPFNVGATSLPHCDLSMDIPDSRFAWGKARFDNLAANLDVEVHGDDLNRIVVRLNRLNLRGPATDLTVRARVSNVIDDPLFDGDLKGSCDLSKLPPVILRYIPGSIRGRLTANASIKGRPSMLTPSEYHRLHVTGDLGLHNLYWIDSDTVNMVYARNVAFAFGTDSHSRSRGHAVDSLLTAKITVDTASVLHSDIAMRLTDFRFNAGAVNRRRHTTAARPSVIPVGGRLQIGSFGVTVLSDTSMVRIRNVDGTAIIRAHNNDMHTPELAFNLGIGRFSAGDRSTRMMFSKARLNLAAFAEPQGRSAKAIRHIADSISRTRPDIPIDSIYAIALRIHNSHSHSRYKRVHPRIERDSTEIIDFGTAKGFSRILTGWNLKGELTAQRAGLFTPCFPIRNRLTNINVRFNNDSVIMNDIRYKAGHSDFSLSGVISNMRRALTSRNGRQPLRVNLSLASDTVDFNQLAETAFAGSAYMAAAAKGQAKVNIGETEDENELERAVLRDVQGATDSMAPFLVPQNIQAELTVHADNVVYSDLILHNLTGKLLSYEGALNLHDLSATSDIGSVNLSALYVGRDPDDLDFGFGLKVNRFNLHRFLDLVPAVDSLMPIMRDFSGIISADIAATSRITPTMDLDIPTLNAAIKLSGDSLVLLDPETFKMLSKWLFFKDKKKNVIDSMTVRMLVKDNRMEMFPFIFNFDRYKLGVQGSNDFAMNFKYHIAVLKSPIPFKFGINISGNPDKYKIRLGGAKLNEKTHLDVALVDTTRVNLVRSIESVFRRGVRNARMKRLNVGNVTEVADMNLDKDTLTHADSVMFIREGLIPAPDTIPPVQINKKGKKSGKNKKKSTAMAPSSPAFDDIAALRPREAILPRQNRRPRLS